MLELSQGRQHEAGHPSARAQVEHSGASDVRKKGKRVFHVEHNRAGTEEAEALRLLEQLEKMCPRVSHGPGDQACASIYSAGAMATRRSGSSPSDLVTTPSSSAMVSCTTFRSADPITSST